MLTVMTSSLHTQVEAKCMLHTSKWARRIDLTIHFPYSLPLKTAAPIWKYMQKYAEIAFRVMSHAPPASIKPGTFQIPVRWVLQPSHWFVLGFIGCSKWQVENTPPPGHNFIYPEILKLSMVIILAIYMLLNICIIKMFGNFVPYCVRSNLRGI